MARVAVLMPVRDAGRFVEKAVQSIIDQTYEDWHLYIVADGRSRDDSADVAASMVGDKGTTLHISPQHQYPGIAEHLNLAIRNSTGEYIARHDADDFSHPSRFATQVEYLDANPSISLLGTSCIFVDESGNGSTVYGKPLDSTQLREDFGMLGGTNNPFFHGSCMVRRSTMEEIGGYVEGYGVLDDLPTWYLLTRKYDSANLPEALYYLRVSFQRADWYQGNRILSDIARWWRNVRDGRFCWGPGNGALSPRDGE